MKGKILEIESSGSWESQHGTMYTYLMKLETENGLTFRGEANAKSETIEGLPYKIGEDVEFEHTESTNSYPDKLKIKKEGSGNYGNGKQQGSNRAFALSYAKDLAVARMRDPDQDLASFSSTKEIIEQADKFVEWLDS